MRDLLADFLRFGTGIINLLVHMHHTCLGPACQVPRVQACCKCVSIQKNGMNKDLFQGNFEDFELPTPLQEALGQMGYEKPTRVQSETFQPISQGKDVIVQSHTGSGKTLAFLLPLVTKVDAKAHTPSILVLTPTRELTQQVYKQLQQLGQATQVKSLAVYGGTSLQQQIQALQEGVHVVIATPGRCKDLLQRGELSPDAIRHCVLDEADEMLSRGFWEDVTEILDRLPTPRQTLLFSATLPGEIQQVCQHLMQDPLHVDLTQQQSSTTCIDHILYVENSSWPKPRNLLYILEIEKAKQSIIFCNRRSDTGLIERYLRNFGYTVRALNGDMPQSVRENALQEIRDGNLDFLVATDIAARGIDISDLSHVFNYGLPESEEAYVHRTGRTGRMGKQGVAISLAHPRNLAYVDRLKTRYELTFSQREFPDEQNILHLQAQRLLAHVMHRAKNVEFGQYQALAQSMLKQEQAVNAFAFLLRSHFVTPSASSHAAAHQTSSAQKPVRTKSSTHSRERQDADEAQATATRHAKKRDSRQGSRETPHDKCDKPGEVRDRQLISSNRTSSQPNKKTRPLRSAKPVRLYVNLGKADGFADLVSLAYYLSQESNVDLGCFTGVGNVRDTSSHVEVDPQEAEQVLSALKDSSYKDKKLVCERARGPGRFTTRR
ncbi:MAG: DEAD/DEAH box helicase [Myxococcota bacterium]